MLLREIHSNVTGVEVFPTNYNNVENKLLVKIAGTIYTCSNKLSTAVRNKTVHLNELGNFEVRDVMSVASEGKPSVAFKSLGYAGEGLSVKFATWATATSSANTVSLEDFTKASTIAELEKLSAVGV